MRQLGWKAAAGVFLVVALSTPVWGASPARPGTLNYVEGQVFIGPNALDARSVGSTELEPGQSLTTQVGKAEILLTPGVFLRVGDNSSVTMVSPSLTNTEVEVNKGESTVEVADIFKQNNIQVAMNGATTTLLERGLYDFQADQGVVRVFDGKAVLQDPNQEVELKGGHELFLNAGMPEKPQKFEKQAYEDDLYRWSSLRSSYLSQANVDAARTQVSLGWYGTGWYWDPWFSSYTFIPGDSIYYSPFGWGFYSPFLAYRAPYVIRPYYHWNFDRDYRYGRLEPHAGPRAFGNGFRAAPGGHMESPRGASGRFRGNEGFHGGRELHAQGAFHGGGFHGGGEGFHGGRGRH